MILDFARDCMKFNVIQCLLLKNWSQNPSHNADHTLKRHLQHSGAHYEYNIIIWIQPANTAVSTSRVFPWLHGNLCLNRDYGKFPWPILLHDSLLFAFVKASDFQQRPLSFKDPGNCYLELPFKYVNACHYVCTLVQKSYWSRRLILVTEASALPSASDRCEQQEQQFYCKWGMLVMFKGVSLALPSRNTTWMSLLSFCISKCPFQRLF